MLYKRRVFLTLLFVLAKPGTRRPYSPPKGIGQAIEE